MNLQARASLGHIPDRAGNRMLSEKDFPGLQYTPSRWRLPSIHERSLLCIGNQPEMRGWIVGVNCDGDFYELLQKFGRFYI